MIRHEVKQLFKAGLDKADLERFHFNADEYAQLNWERQKEEFIWHGKKYDIYEIQHLEDGSLVLLAWLDHRESKLKKGFEALLEKHLPQPLPSEKQVWQQLKNQFLDLADHQCAFNIALLRHGQAPFAILTRFREIATPPPQT